MVQAVSIHEIGGPAQSNGNDTASNTAIMEGSQSMPYLSTEPAPNANYQVTLSNKIIAISGANRGIGLGLAEVCLVNNAAVVYSLDITAPD
jgi:hypothetical protein